MLKHQLCLSPNVVRDNKGWFYFVKQRDVLVDAIREQTIAPVIRKDLLYASYARFVGMMDRHTYMFIETRPWT